MNRNKKLSWYVWLILALPVAYCGLLIGQYYQADMNLSQWLEIINTAFGNPLQIHKTDYGVKFALALLALYAMAVLYYHANNSNSRKGEEHGSARWANVAQVCAKYRYKIKAEPRPFTETIKIIKESLHKTLAFIKGKAPPKKKQQSKPIDTNQNIILSKSMRLGMNPHQHRRNLNMLVVGGSGAGKTRFFVKPNLMQLNCSYVITDPKTEILYATGEMFKAAGYKIKVLNLIDMKASHCYNPFHYLRNENDVIRLIANLVKSTNEKGQKSSDPFWEKSESALLQALIFFLMHRAPKSEQNFSMVCEMLEYARVSDENDSGKTELDELFDILEEEEPDHIAVKQYKIFKQAGGKTAMSILVSAAVRLTPFNLPEIKRLTSKDEMEIESYGDEKTVCFAVIPDNDTSINFIVSMLYTQLFQALYYQADNIHKGRLPVHVRFIMDEFANGVTRSQLKRLSVKLKNMFRIERSRKPAVS